MLHLQSLRRYCVALLLRNSQVSQEDLISPLESKTYYVPAVERALKQYLQIEKEKPHDLAEYLKNERERVERIERVRVVLVSIRVVGILKDLRCDAPACRRSLGVAGTV